MNGLVSEDSLNRGTEKDDEEEGEKQNLGEGFILASYAAALPAS